MKVSIVRNKAGRVTADLRIIPVAVDGVSSGVAGELTSEEKEAVAKRAKKVSFTGKAGSSMMVQAASGDLLLVGIGKKKDVETYRRAAARAAGVATSTRAGSVAFCLGSAAAAKKLVEPVIEGFRLSVYRYDKYKSKASGDKSPKIKTLTVAGGGLPSGAAATKIVNRMGAVIDSVFMARDLINETSGVKTPNYLVATAKGIAKGTSVSCEVWQGKRLEKEKMNGIIAVSAGSMEPGAFIKMVYKPAKKARAIVAVVGKGITFDSGGLSLKPAKSMEWMKQDMSGAAAVLGVMKAVSVLKPNVEVRGYVAAAENMPGERAQKPGDVITYRNGKTAEVLNTDAEGRLVLADALCVASEEKPDCIIDLATLTGACMVALGTRIAGVMGNNQKLINDLIKNGESTGERLWQLPLPDDYKADIKSGIADIQNIGSGYGGTITAALFLEAFVGDTKWAHLDIAGPAFVEKPLPYMPRGGTGFGVRALLSYIEAL